MTVHLEERVLPCAQVYGGEPCGCPNGSTIDLLLGIDDLASLSFGHDSVWETVASLAVLARPQSHVLHRRLLRSIPTPTWDHDLLMSLFAREHWYPVFLAPSRAPAAIDPPAALRSLAETDPTVVANDLETLRAARPDDPRWRSYSPERLAEETAAALASYWGVVLAPRWERIAEIAAADVAHRSRVLAGDGLGATLGDLHQRLSYADGRLRLRCEGGHHQHRRVGGAGVRFLASVFVWPHVVAEIETAPAVVSYPALGAGRLWDPSTRVRHGGLDAVMGRSRLEILRELGVPTTTTRISRRLRLSAATVSQHLTRLSTAGLVSSSRRGREVFYERTPLGHSLVEPSGPTGELGADGRWSSRASR